MKYIILFTKMLFISCLIVSMGIAVTACSDDKSELQSGYGYAQFKLYKSASYKSEEPGATRSGVNELEYLRDAQKMKVVLLNNADGTEIVQTVGLEATSEANAEFGLHSEKLQLLPGEYTVVGYYLYKIAGQELEEILSSEPDETTVIKVVDGGLAVQDLTVKAVKRGSVTFTLTKVLPETRANINEGEYQFQDIAFIDITVQDQFLIGKKPIDFKKIAVVYTEKAKNKDGQSYKYSVSISDSLLSLRAGTYKVVKYQVYNKNNDKLGSINAFVAENSFEVKDNETTEATVPIELKRTDEKIKDYLALKAIWDALDGPHWRYSGQAHTEGVNWDFNKDIDMWGNQPGVELDSKGRVIVLNIGGFGASGDIPDALGDLTELKLLTLGTHSDKMGDNVFEQPSAGSLPKEVFRADYYNKFIKTDVRATFSEPLQLGFKLKDNKPVIKGKRVPANSRVSTRDVSAGNYTNGIKSLPKTIRNLTKLQQLYIANGFIETLPEEIKYLAVCSDIEVYNCPKMTKFPDVLAQMPKLELLNIANNPQIPSAEFIRGLKLLAATNSKSAKTLQILYLGNNVLEELPEEFKNLKKLGKLDCFNNKIKKIYPFGKSVNLVQLSMDFNQITEIPTDAEGYFCGYEDVESFSFSNNKLTKVPNIFNAGSVYVMSSVNFGYNQITGFDGETNGTYKGINAGTVLLNNNKLKRFPAILFEKGSPIKALNLSGNGMSEFPDGSLKGSQTYWLQSLDLTFNLLTQLPKEFNATTVPYMYGLDMSYNRFSKFPTAPLNIDHLTVFGLRNQRDQAGNRTISDWPTGISLCPSLRALYLGGNDFRKIDDTLSYLIYMFDISDNPNIVLDVTAVCPYIKAGVYQLIYDRSQDIRGCDYLKLDK